MALATLRLTQPDSHGSKISRAHGWLVDINVRSLPTVDLEITLDEHVSERQPVDDAGLDDVRQL
jgi:hypothetical protein